MLKNVCRILLLFPFLAGLACVPTPRPAPLANFLARAEPLVAERRYTEAVTLLEEAAKSHPENPLPLLKIGQIYLTQRRWLLAEDAFNRALARDPHQPLAAVGLAETWVQQGRLTEALKLWQEIVITWPDLKGVFTGLGRTYLLLFDFAAAKEAFLQQQAHRPDPEAQWYLAGLEAPLDLAAARAYLLAITPSGQAIPSPDDASRDLLARRDYLLTTLAPFTPTSPQAEVAKATGIALAQGQMWPLAAHALTIANEKHPEDAETIAFLAHVLAQAGRPALDLFEQAQRLDPTSALPLYFQGLYLRQQEALRAAEAVFSQALKLDPENAAIYAELAQTKAQQGNFALAEAYYLAAIEVAADDDLQFRLLLANFYAERGYRLSEAGIPLAEAIIAADKNKAEGYDLLGWMQFLSGAPDGGEAAIRQAIQLNPDLVSAHYHLARQLEIKGQTAAAAATYQRVIDWDITGSFRDRALKALQRLVEARQAGEKLSEQTD